MTFKDIAIKNFKYHFSKYLLYFLCISFAIMIFFMFTTTINNEELIKEVEGTPFMMVMNMALGIVGIFSFFFISYAYSSFLKSKYKEIGLYLSLGMSHKQVNKIIRVENTLLILFSLILGLLSGSIFSKLYFMAFTKIIAFNEVAFSLNIASYIQTTLVFLLIFMIILVISKYQVNKIEIFHLIRQGRKTSKQHKSPYLGLIGFIILTSSLVMLFIYVREYSISVSFNIFLISIGLNLIGLYLIIIGVGDLITKFGKTKKSLYNKNILVFSEIRHKFNINKKILYTITLLTTLVIYFLGLTFSIYLTTIDRVKNEMPFDILVIEAKDFNNLSDEELNEITTSGDTLLIDKRKLEIIQLPSTVGYSLDSINLDIPMRPLVITSESKINEFSNLSLDVKKGETLAIIGHAEKHDKFYMDNQKLFLFNDDTTYSFDLTNELQMFVINYNTYLRNTFILDDTDYQKIKNQVDENIIEYVHGFNYDNWRKTDGIMSELVTRLKELNNISDGLNPWDFYLQWDLYPPSKVKTFEVEKKIASTNFFIISSLGVLLFISTGIVLYFKIYNDLPYQKLKYSKLRLVGITDKEITLNIKKELKIFFFVPLFLASILGLTYIFVTTSAVAGFTKLLMYSLLFTLIYFFVQYTFYLITKNSYINEIIK